MGAHYNHSPLTNERALMDLQMPPHRSSVQYPKSRQWLNLEVLRLESTVAWLEQKLEQAKEEYWATKTQQAVLDVPEAVRHLSTCYPMLAPTPVLTLFFYDNLHRLA